MGFRSSWIAVEKRASAEALAKVELRDTGARCSILETGWWGLDLTDWYCIVGSGWDHMGRIEEEHAKQLSSNGRALFWTADDSYMRARMVMYENGSPSLDHEDLKPTTEGPVPPAVKDALSTQRKKQDAETQEVDHLYEAAHIAGHALVGFRHDDSHPPEGAELITLRPLDEPEPVRTVEKHGPFSVELVTNHEGGLDVAVEATTSVEVERFVTVIWDDGEILSVIEAEGGKLAAGDRRDFHLQNPETVLTIVTSEKLATKSIHIRVPTG